jgi:hypothetical protein
MGLFISPIFLEELKVEGSTILVDFFGLLAFPTFLTEALSRDDELSPV